MPKYTLMHGGLTVKMKAKDKAGEEVEIHHAAKPDDEVELSTEEAAKLNKRGEHVKLSAVIKAEAEAEVKRKEQVAKITARVEAEIAAEEEKAKKNEKKGGAQ